VDRFAFESRLILCIVVNQSAEFRTNLVGDKLSNATDFVNHRVIHRCYHFQSTQGASPEGSAGIKRRWMYSRTIFRIWSGIGVVRKSIYRYVYYSHQVTTSTRIQRWPKGKIVICGGEFWTIVRPGVFRVRPIAGKRRCKMFDVVCDWYYRPNPDLKIGVSFERE
jgi:hypothetical protein